MFHRMNRPSLRFPLKILYVSVLQLLLTHSCRGQSQLIGSSQPIVATVGDDIILPCQLNPAEDVAALTLEWTRADLGSINVHVRRAGQDLTHVKHPSYQGRTSLFIDELKQGNISLKLSRVKLSDGGKYRCFIPQLSKQSFVELVVGAVSPPVISLAGIDRDRGGVELQCESKGWHPQPEVFWLDSERNLLSAGPTETVRGPDGLYTVSSRVTVEKRLSNNFTCRVEQKNTNQIRETYIIVPDDFFKAQSSSSSVIIGLAVSLVVSIMSIVAVFFFVWKWKQNMIKTKSCWDETEGGGNKNLSKSDDPEMHPLNVVDTDGEMFTVTTAVSEETKEKKVKKNKHLEEKQTDTDRLLQEEKQNREKAEREVRTMKNQLESKQQEIENKQAECDLLMKLQLHEENQRREERDLQTLKENLETKELEKIKPGWFASTKKEKAEKEKEVETLKKELQTKQEELETKTKEIKEIIAELQKLRDENQRKETDLQRQTEETNNKERREEVKNKHKEFQDKISKLERKQAATNRLLQEKQNREKEEKDLNLESKQKQIDTKHAEVQNLQTNLNTKTTEIETLKAEHKKEWERKQAATDGLLQEEKQDRERDVEDLKTQLDSKTLQESEKHLKAQNKEIEKLLQLLEENERIMKDLQNLKENLETKTKELENIKTTWFLFSDEEQQRKEEVETLKKDLQTKQKEFETKTKEIEALKAELQRKEGDLQRQTEETNNKKTQAGKNSTEVLVEVDPNGKYLLLTNKSKEDLKLEGWKLRVKLNHENPIMYTFEKSFKLGAGWSVNIWVPGCGTHFPPSNLIWKDLNRWTKGDKLLVELINCDEEIVKTIETQGTSKHNNTNPADKNSTVFVEIDPKRKYLRLTNGSKKDLELKGWKLRVKLNDQNSIMLTFKKSVILKAEKFVTIWVPGCVTHSSPSDLVWEELNRWTRENKLLVELINCDGDIVTTTEGDKSLHGENSDSAPISPQKKTITVTHPLQ